MNARPPVRSTRYRYRTIEFETFDLHVRALRDNQQFNDPDSIAEQLGVSPSSWPLAGLVWESAEVLARLMDSIDTKGRRILEVGCGIGLVSLLLQRRSEDITATDYHPEAAANLRWNAMLNKIKPVKFVRANWETDTDLLGKFDLVVGSDVLYEPDHPELLSNFILAHCEQDSEVIIVDPSRGHASKFSKRMDLAGFKQTAIPVKPFINDSLAYRGHIRHYTRHTQS